jgi:anti-sigma B factor antagonist
MEFLEERFDAVTVLHLRGKIMGGPETQTLCRRLHELLEADQRFWVMNFQEVQWINSSGIGAIIACLNALRERGGDIRFAHLQGLTRRYFHMTKLETVTQSFNTVEQAAQSFVETSSSV